MKLIRNPVDPHPSNHGIGNQKRVPPSGKRLLSLMISQVLALGAVPHIVHAATMNVDSNAQEVTTSNPNGINNGNCTLGEAILAANSDDTTVDNCSAGSGADTIELQSSMVYTLTDVAEAYGGDGTGLPLIRSEIIFNGNNSTIERDNAAPDFRILYFVHYGMEATLNQITIRNGSANGPGSGIRNGGNLTINDSAILENTTASYRGGGIQNAHGDLTINNSTISGNTSNQGAGIITYGGTLTISDSTISGNSSHIGSYGTGAGIWNGNESTLKISNSTISGNAATEYAGGIGSHGPLVEITNSTISGNSAKRDGGIFTYDSLHLKNTIIANNTNGDCNDHGGIITNMNNLIEDGSCSPMFSDDPNLGLIADNGGPTQTHALLPGSPAIDAGDNDACPATDQRGVTRPFNGICDIGSYEMVDIVVTIEAQSNLSLPPEGGSISWYAKLVNTTDDAVTYRAWSYAILPSGPNIDPHLGPITLTRGPGTFTSPTYRLDVPGNAPSGAYQYCVEAADLVGNPYDEDCFTFTKATD